MADSWQLAILKAMTDHLAGITIPSDMSNSVFRGRLIYGENDPLPMISIVESLSADVIVNTAGMNHVNREETWVLLVQGWVKHDGINPTDGAYNFKAAVEQRMSMCVDTDSFGDPVYPDLYMLGFHGTVIDDMSIGPGVVSVSQRPEASDRAFFYLPVGITLALDITKPYAT